MSLGRWERPALITGKDAGLKTVVGKLLTVREVAVFMRTSVSWVHKHMRNGTFPMRTFVIGEREYRIDSADLDDWLKRTQIPAGEKTNSA